MTICKKFELSFVFFLNGLIEFAILHAIVTFHSGIFVVMCANTDYRCPMKLFFIGIQNFWAWVDKFWGIWGIFGLTISTHFGTVSPLSMFSIVQPLFLQITNPLYVSTSQIFIWDSDLSLGHKELGI